MSGPEGNHLIARIYDDGLVEYEDIKDLHSFADYEIWLVKKFSIDGTFDIRLNARHEDLATSN